MTDVGKAIRSALLTARHIAAPLTHEQMPEPNKTGVHDLPRRGGFARGGPAPAQMQNEGALEDAAPVGTKQEQNPDLFDFSGLSKQPNVPQFDLPRNRPARGVPERVADLIKNRMVQRKMLEHIHAGLGTAGAGWHNTEPLLEHFIRHLGKSKGQEAHNDFMHFVAASSPRERVPGNVRKASILHHAHVSGAGIPEDKDYPGLPLHLMNARRYVAGTWDPRVNAKPISFAQNLSGNWKPGTIDTHAFRLPAVLAQDTRFLDTAYEPTIKGPNGKPMKAPKRNIQHEVESGKLSMKDVSPGMWQSAPKDNEYAAMEDYYKKLGAKAGVSTAQTQAGAWVGGGHLTGLGSDPDKTFLHFLQDRVYKTAHETGVDPETVLKDFITGKIPLRADGGPVTDPAAPQTPAMWQNPNFQKWFAGSKVVNGQGQPDTLYHGTAGDFDVFRRRRNDIGMHFGTVGQANDRLSYQRERGVKPLDGMNLMPVHLAIKNPLRLTDLGRWDGDGLAWELARKFPDEAKWISLNVRTPAQARAFLQSKGHDGIVYKNTGEVGGSEPYRAAIKDATTELHKHFPKNKNSFDHTDQRHPAYQAYRAAHDKHWEHKESNGEDSYIAFEPHQIKSALGNNGEFSPRNPSIVRADGGPVVGDGAATPLGPSAPSPAQIPVPSRGKPSIATPVHQPRAFNGAGMYSHAVEQALALPQVRGAPQQMLASMKGVKKEELDHSSPLQKFAGRPSVTREELAGHFRHAMPRIHESEFNDYEPEDPDAPPNDTQYGDYTIPGGKNYRELLLHLPETKYDFNHPDIKAAAKRHTEASEAGRAYYRDHARAAPLWGSHKDMAAAGRDPIFEDPEYKRLQEEATQTNAAYVDTVMRHKNAAKEKDFYSDHWPTANVLAHLRLSDREVPVGGPKSPIWYRHVHKQSGHVGAPFPTMEALEQEATKHPESMRKQLEVQPTAGPKEKITHMEELQSDWGQQGRENGFRDPNFDVEKGKETLAQLHRDMAVREHHALTTGADYNSLPGAENDREIDELTQKLEHHKRAVPHGPYVTSTNGWTDLGLKRALLEAARNGSDRLAWTPGQEQADRYGLAKHYANLNWHRGFEYGTKPGEGTLVAYRHGQGGDAAPAVWQTMHEDELPEHIGAELAQRLLSQPEHKALEGVTSQRLEGDDLKVGGEGMKAYYDKIVPGRLKEILKKLGHEAKFEPLMITHKPKDNTPPGPHNMRTTLHSVHLPPDLRDKIKRGLPAFAKGGAVKTPVTMRAAGVILRDPEDRVLFVKRNPKGGDHGGEWAFPGGKIERGETPAQAAVRETHEEIGHKIEGSLKQVDARVSKEGVHFTTFDHRVGKQFAPKLNEEHSEFRWAHPNSAPSPLHPGAKATLTKGPARAYAAGGGVHYDTHQDGPFWRVARREDGAHPSLQRRAGPEVRGPGGAPDGGAAGPVGDGGAQSPAARRLAQLQAVADRHAHSHGHGSVVDAGNSESSLHKQSAIGRAFQLAATDHPGYKRAVFAAYQRQHPELVREARARNYDELRHAAYTKLGHEVKQQFDDLPVRTSYHRHGEGDYESSKHMRHDVLENGHLNVFQGGDRHDFLHHVDPRTQLNENEMFRAIHDAYGHALHGSGFGAKGEERAWNAHRQMFSPLAALAMSAETRGQNSFVNYTPINAELTAAKHEKEAQIARAKRFGDAEAVKQHEKDKKDIMSGWKYAPQRAVLLPPEMVDPKYEGGMPDYLQHLIKPEPGTGLSSPITHFSPSPDVKELDPGRYGTGIKGDERARVLKRPGGVKERVYGYLGAPNQVKPEPGLGPYAYAGQANDLYDLTHDPVRLGLLATEANRSNPLGNFNPGVVNTAQAQNDTERMAKEHGYSGVANPKAAYPMAAVFGKVPVTPAAGSDVVDRALEMTRRRSTP